MNKIHLFLSFLISEPLTSLEWRLLLSRIETALSQNPKIAVAEIDNEIPKDIIAVVAEQTYVETLNRMLLDYHKTPEALN